MKTYNAFIGLTVKVMNLQEMFDAAYEMAQRSGSCKVWDFDNDEMLIHSYKTSDGRIVTIYSEEIAKELAA